MKKAPKYTDSVRVQGGLRAYVPTVVTGRGARAVWLPDLREIERRVRAVPQWTRPTAPRREGAA